MYSSFHKWFRYSFTFYKFLATIGPIWVKGKNKVIQTPYRLSGSVNLWSLLDNSQSSSTTIDNTGPVCCTVFLFTPQLTLAPNILLGNRGKCLWTTRSHSNAEWLGNERTYWPQTERPNNIKWRHTYCYGKHIISINRPRSSGGNVVDSFHDAMKSRVGTNCHVSSTEVVINRANQANNVQVRTIRCLFGRYLTCTINIIMWV